MKNNNKERRAGMEDMKANISDIATDIALMKNMIEMNHKTMRETTDRIMELVEKHDKTLYGNGSLGLTGKFSKITDIDKAMDDHRVSDRWIHGTVITFLIFILGKIFLIK